jgi:hypothetical protein
MITKFRRLTLLLPALLWMTLPSMGTAQNNAQTKATGTDVAKPAVPKDTRPYIPVDSFPARKPLDKAMVRKIQQMPLLFDGKTLNGWIQVPVSSLSFAREDVIDIAGLAKRLNEKSDPVSEFLYQQLDSAGLAGVAASIAGNKEPKQTISPITRTINKVIKAGTLIYTDSRFKGITLSPKTMELLKKNPTGADLTRLNRLLLEDVYSKELIKSPDASWVVKDSALVSTGACRGMIYTDKDYSNYRLIFKVRQTSGNHYPSVIVFGVRPPVGELGLDALGGIQFGLPSGGHWDYRPGVNNSGSIHYTQPVKIRFDGKKWAQVEILVNGQKGTARMAVAQPLGTRSVEVLDFTDPTVNKIGPIGLQEHNALLFDEYKDIRVEIDPKEDKLITLDTPE